MSDVTTTAPMIDGAILEQVVVGGDLSKLSPTQRLAYYRQVCESLNLNPLTKPFEYLHLNGRLVLYATRTATDQLAKQHQLTLSVVRTERIEDVYLVTARAAGPDGRSVENVGAVSLASLRGDALANSLMKALTKAYRRATLSYCGLGWLDETEIETIPEARRGEATEAGEGMTPPPPAEKAPPPPAEKPPLNRAQLIEGWQKLVARGARVGIKVDKLNQSWTDKELLAKGRSWKERIEERETEVAEGQFAAHHDEA